MVWTARRARRFGTLLLLYGVAAAASAQWAWRDENGRTVYSDQPPPVTVKQSDLLRQPEPAPNPPSDSNGIGGPSQPNTATAAPATKPAASPAPKAPTMAERELEFRKRMKERADAEKKLADAEAEASRKTEDCERARSYLQSLDSGVRLVRTNPDGSPELMDEAQRAAEAQRAHEIIDTRCN